MQILTKFRAFGQRVITGAPATPPGGGLPAQLVRMMPESKRKIIASAPAPDETIESAALSVAAFEGREVDIKPYRLIDRAGLAAPIIHEQARGRTERLPASYVTFMRNVRVSGAGLFLNADDEMLPESCIREHHAYRQRGERVEIRNTQPISQIAQRIADPTIVLTGVFPLHFSHWLFDNYAKLAAAKKVLGDLSGYKVAVGFGTRRGGWCKPDSVQFECLSFLGVKHENIIMLPEHRWTHFDNAIVLSEVNNFKPPAQNIWSAPEIFSFFDDVYRLAGLERRTPSKRVHLSRTDNNNRKCMNEPEVIALAKALGFEEKIVAGMTMKEQMAYFSDIAVACGPVGNNLLTMCFMQPGSKIVTYFPPQASHLLTYYQAFCSAIGIDLYAVCATSPGASETPALDALRWEADVGMVESQLNEITGEL